jgi:hypothetical protein
MKYFSILLFGIFWLPAGDPFMGTKKARTTELLLDPGFRGAIRLYAAPDKKRQVKLLRHNAKAEDWVYFVVRASNDSPTLYTNPDSRHRL